MLPKVLNAMGVNRLWLLLDEWSNIPVELQPILADLICRSLLPAQSVTVKIAAIEERSRFKRFQEGGDYLGFELGADIAADVNLDDFMVFGNDEDKAKTFFGELLFRHVQPHLPADAVFTEREDFIRHAFTQQAAFTELVRAAEGVPRDCIEVARFAAQKADSQALSVPLVRAAAKTHYHRDKESAATANENARELLHWLIDEVIGKRQARAFMLQQGAPSQDELIRLLYDARILHVVRRGVAAKDKPGVRFNVYSIDYGCYVDLISTARAPQGLLQIEDERGSSQYVNVPADSYRSIRSAILDLKAFYARPSRFF